MKCLVFVAPKQSTSGLYQHVVHSKAPDGTFLLSLLPEVGELKPMEKSRGAQNSTASY